MTRYCWLHSYFCQKCVRLLLQVLAQCRIPARHVPRPAICLFDFAPFDSQQAIFYAETKANYVNLFDACCDLWTARHPNKKPLQQQMSLQLHKDFHPSIEEARRHVWPLSRPCDDFFHFKEKSHTTMQAKCQLVSRKGKFVKKYVHFALEVINILRFVPTLPLFSWLWKAFLATLRRLGEPTLADWLQTYERPMPAIFQGHHSPDIIFVSFWVGFDGILPGSGSGSEPAEAIHSSWQRELNQRKHWPCASCVAKAVHRSLAALVFVDSFHPAGLCSAHSRSTIGQWHCAHTGWAHLRRQLCQIGPYRPLCLAAVQ